MRPTALGVIGLGCIGGSLAWSAKRAGLAAVLGWSPEPAERVAAVKQGALDDAPHRPEEVAGRVDLLVLAAPPAANLEWLDRLKPHLPPTCLVTDTGSVKRAIVDRARALGLAGRFAGSHPLAGSHESGFKAARPELFARAVVYVTPMDGGGAGDPAAREVAHFWQNVIGADAVMMSADQHDAQLAVTSHLPQVVASLLARELDREAPAGAALGAGARDTTRLAAGNPDLWAQILLLNRDEVLPALTGVEDGVAELRRCLVLGEVGGVRRWLAQGADWRRRLDA
jgi:prephenate dehydrogenase